MSDASGEDGEDFQIDVDNSNSSGSDERAGDNVEVAGDNDGNVEQRMIRLQNNQRRMLMNRVNRMIHGFRGNFGRYFYPEGNDMAAEVQDSGSDSENEEQENHQQPDENMTYDVSLPTSHSYLGEMEECSGLTYQEASQNQSIPILSIDDFVPVPGQTFALRVTDMRDTSQLHKVFQTPSKTFGLLPLRSERFDFEETMDFAKQRCDFGCTVEIRMWNEQTQPFPQIQIVGIARNRFDVIQRHAQVDGTLQATVHIVVDRKLPNLGDNVGCSRNLSHSSVPGCKIGITHEQELFLKERAPEMLIRHKDRCRRTQMASCSTSWPSWVYRQYDEHYLRVVVFEQMSKWHGKLQPHQCPTDATEFSFYVIARLPLSNDLKLRLIRLRCPVQRLRCLYGILSKWTTLNCSNCSRLVAHRKDVFSMSASGPMAAYVNPGGVVHETLTLHKAHSLFLSGHSSDQDSWFPGYKWTICHCRGCSRHMGWKFTATTDDLKPQSFWGLTRSALQSKIEDHDLASSGVGDNRVLII